MKRVVLDKYMDILGYNDRPRWLDKYLDCPSLLRLKNVGYFCGMDYASKKIYDFVILLGFNPLGLSGSGIKGGSGNTEYLIYLKKETLKT